MKTEEKVMIGIAGSAAVAGTIALIAGRSGGSSATPAPTPPPSGQSQLYGTVSDKSTGKPISGAGVAVALSDGTTGSATSKSDGTYVIPGLPIESGDSWAASDTGYQDASGTVNLTGGNVLLNIQMTATGASSGTGEVTAQVVDQQTSQVVVGATVTIGGQTGKTGSNGVFDIKGVPLGQQSGSIQMNGYVTYPFSVNVASGLNQLNLITMSETPTGTDISVTIDDSYMLQNMTYLTPLTWALGFSGSGGKYWRSDLNQPPIGIGGTYVVAVADLQSALGGLTATPFAVVQCNQEYLIGTVNETFTAGQITLVAGHSYVFHIQLTLVNGAWQDTSYVTSQ